MNYGEQVRQWLVEMRSNHSTLVRGLHPVTGVETTVPFMAIMLDTVIKQQSLIWRIQAALDAAEQQPEIEDVDEQQLQELQLMVDQCDASSRRLEELKQQLVDTKAACATYSASAFAHRQLQDDLEQQLSEIRAQYRAAKRQAAADAAAANAAIQRASDAIRGNSTALLKAATYTQAEAVRIAGAAANQAGQDCLALVDQDIVGASWCADLGAAYKAAASLRDDLAYEYIGEHLQVQKHNLLPISALAAVTRTSQALSSHLTDCGRVDTNLSSVSVGRYSAPMLTAVADFRAQQMNRKVVLQALLDRKTKLVNGLERLSDRTAEVVKRLSKVVFG